MISLKKFTMKLTGAKRFFLLVWLKGIIFTALKVIAKLKP